MNATLNKHRLNNLLRGIQTSINLFESQGHTDVYFTAQFYRGGRKQNGIERGDISGFGKQVRTYVASEEADSARIEFFNERTGKSIYSKAINDLRISEAIAIKGEPAAMAIEGLNGYVGLGEAQVEEMIDRKVAEQRRNDEFQRLNKEVDELRTRNEVLTGKNDDLEARIKAKDGIEFYSGIIGAALPGLAPLLAGTPLAQAAGFLAGIGDSKELPMAQKEEHSNDDSESITEMVAEFCDALNTQEASAVHLLFMAFEADRSKIQSALHYITTTAPEQAA